MQRHRTHYLRSRARRGVVLLVVLALLTLFAAVGVAFVMFSEQEGNSAQIGLQATQYGRPDPDLLLGYFLNQLMLDYVAPKNQPNLNALQTHSLLVNMYGPSGNTPFNSIGRRHRAPTDPMDPVLGTNDQFFFPNFQLRSFAGSGGEAFFGSLNAPYTYADLNSYFLGAMDASGVVWARSFVRAGINPITGQPFNAYDPANGAFWMAPPAPINYTSYGFSAQQMRAMVMRPGPWDHPQFAPPADAGGDVKNLPPGTQIVLPGGTVSSGNDSYWIDLGFPDQIGPDGKRYRPLFAFFIMDLDGKVNLNAAGNIRGANNNNASNRGFSPTEISLNKILVDYTNAMRPPTGEMPAVFEGTGPAVSVATSAPFQVMGRYGVGADDKALNRSARDPVAQQFGAPIASYLFPRIGPVYGQTDLDGCFDNGSYTGSAQYSLPGGPTSLPYDRFPRFFNFTNQPTNQPPDPTTSPNADVGYPYSIAEAWGNERLFHPMNFNVFSPGGGNRTFGAYNMEALLRHGDTNADALQSDIRRLLPLSLNFAQARGQLTTHSFDIGRPGVMPWNYGTSNRLKLNGNTTANFNLQGGSINFPNAPPPPPPAGEFLDPTLPSPPFLPFSWRSLYASLGRIDLNRPLPDYPRVDQTAPPTGAAVTGRLDLTNQAVRDAFTIATQARQRMARDIYLGFIKASGGYDPTDPNQVVGPTPEEFNGLRWLAQLAVNIVDFIDNDDYMTPFNWGSVGSPAFAAANNGQWVIGTELPRLVVNEAYAQYTQAAVGTATDVSVWIELYDPLSDLPANYPLYYQQDSFADVTKGFPTQPLAYGTAKLENRPTAINGATDDRYAIYRVILSQTDPNLRNADKVIGDPDPALVLRKPDPNSLTATKGVCIVGQNQPNVGWNPLITNEAQDLNYPNADWTNPSGVNQLTAIYTSEVVQPSGTLYAGTNGGNTGFYMLGPSAFPTASITATLQKSEMQYRLPAGTNAKQNQPTVILQRLACPHIPPDPNQFLPSPPNPPNTPNPNYNPYVTVDYMENLLVNQDTDNPRNSVGRKQPYAALGSGGNKQWIPSTDPVLTAQMPQQTFFAHNNDQAPPFALMPAWVPPTTWPPPPTYLPNNYAPTFDWLVHLDRNLVSPMELLQVSLYKPHELTQQFVTTNGKFQHLQVQENAGNPPALVSVIPWFEQNFRLYRALEFFECRSPTSGVANLTFVFNGNLNAGQQLIDLTTAANNPNPFNLTLSNALGFPAGVTSGNGALWGIREGTTLIIDGGTANEEAVLVLGPNTTPTLTTMPPFPNRQVVVNVMRNHGGGNPVTVTVPYYRGRQPGKININTVMDPETFRALCDPQICNSFWGPNVNPITFPNPDDFVTAIFNNYLKPGSPNYAKPFASLGAGYDAGSTQWPATGMGINQTILRLQDPTQPPGPNNPPVLAVPGQQHPYLQSDLMVKLFNNVTVRSNVFAVWCTVGFFETNANGQLGAEIGRVDGKQLRHRFFAIADRSVLDPWVQMMNALLGTYTTSDWLVQYDVALGVLVTPRTANPMTAAPTVGNGAGQIPPQLIIPLLGNAALDPRKDYSVIPIPQPSNAAGLPSGPPATVLHWTVIQ
jgi:hypothetical protein